jgi:hypothetical protein
MIVTALAGWAGVINGSLCLGAIDTYKVHDRYRLVGRDVELL